MIGGLSMLGADVIDEVTAAAARRERVEQAQHTQDIFRRAGEFVRKHWFTFLVGGAALGGFFLLLPKGGAGYTLSFSDEPPSRKVPKPPPVRSYAALGASRKMIESSLRVRRGYRKDVKMLKKMGISKRLASSGLRPVKR